MAKVEMSCGCGQKGLAETYSDGNPPPSYICDGCLRKAIGREPAELQDIVEPRGLGRLFRRRG